MKLYKNRKLVLLTFLSEILLTGSNIFSMSGSRSGLGIYGEMRQTKALHSWNWSSSGGEEAIVSIFLIVTRATVEVMMTDDSLRWVDTNGEIDELSSIKPRPVEEKAPWRHPKTFPTDNIWIQTVSKRKQEVKVWAQSIPDRRNKKEAPRAGEMAQHLRELFFPRWVLLSPMAGLQPL